MTHYGIPPSLKSYVCVDVLDGSPVLYVTRPDGDWCLLCGGEHPTTLRPTESSASAT